MKTSKVLYGIALLAVVVAMGSTAYAIDNGFQVRIPNEILVNDKVLPAGEYEIRKLSNVNAVLQFYNRDAMRYETNALPIHAEANEVVEEPKIVMQKVGNNYYLTEVWMSGTKSGYELPLPQRARSLQRELEQTVTGHEIQSTPVASNQPAASTSTDARSDTTPVAEAERSEVEPAEGEPVEVEAQVQSEVPQVAQNVPSQQQVDPRPIDPSPAAEQSPANAQDDVQQNALPATASHWSLYLLIGGVLLTLAIAVRRV